MTSERRYAISALILAGIMWGASMALSKVCLEWLSPTWLTVGRFLTTGLVLAVIGRRGLRAALSPRVAVSGIFGFGICIVLQNVGLQYTSVSHAAVLTGVVPALVALVGVVMGHGHASRREWASYAIAVTGIVLIAGGGGGGASVGGDVLVLISVALSAVLIAGQPRVLEGRDPAAVTAVQFIAAGLSVTPFLFMGGGGSLAVHSAGPVVAFVALALFGTLAPFWLFAYGQARVPARLAGAFVNLEPVVGAVVGWVAFSDPFTALGLLGACAVIGAIVLASTEGSFGLTTVRRRVLDAAFVDRLRAGVDPAAPASALRLAASAYRGGARVLEEMARGTRALHEIPLPEAFEVHGRPAP